MTESGEAFDKEEAYRLDLERARKRQKNCKHAAVDAATRICVYCGLKIAPTSEIEREKKTSFPNKGVR